MNETLFRKFLTACEQKEMKLLKDDVVFIKKCLCQIPYKLHRDVLRRYINQWLNGMEKNLSSSLAPNFWRFGANSWLRYYKDGIKKKKIN